jgi:hypothetical protein
MPLYKTTPERGSELKLLSPHARFEIPSEKTGSKYQWWLQALIEECITEVDERNSCNFVRLNEESGSEGGIIGFYANQEFFTGCKLYWYDGTPNGTPLGYQKGCLFRDHEYTVTVLQIFLLADAFAEYLKKQQIPFALNARYRSNRVEFCRARFPA